MTKKEEDAILNTIRDNLENMDFRDIKVCQNLRKYKVPLATFILCSCFIDHMAQYTYYDPKRPRDVGRRFMKFVTIYMPAYDAGKLYGSLRSNLVHNYSVSGEYILGYDRKGKHLKVHSDGRIWLNLHKFIADLQVVFNTFLNHIYTNIQMRQSALLHYQHYKTLQPAKIP